MAWKLKQDSSHVLRVKFIDGNKRTLYSMDWQHQFSKYKDPEMGLSRLRKKIGEWGYRAESVAIYINDGKKTGNPIERYANGTKIN